MPEGRAWTLQCGVTEPGFLFLIPSRRAPTVLAPPGKLPLQQPLRRAQQSARPQLIRAGMGTLPVQPREVIAMNCENMLVVPAGQQKLTRVRWVDRRRGKGGKLRPREI